MVFLQKRDFIQMKDTVCTVSRLLRTRSKDHTSRDRPIMLIFHLLCYAAVLKNFTYYAQNYAQK